MIAYGWGNVCYLVNFPPGNIYYVVKYPGGGGLLYSKYSEGNVYYIVNIPGEAFLYDTGTLPTGRMKPSESNHPPSRGFDPVIIIKM